MATIEISKSFIFQMGNNSSFSFGSFLEFGQLLLLLSFSLCCLAEGGGDGYLRLAPEYAVEEIRQDWAASDLVKAGQFVSITIPGKQASKHVLAFAPIIIRSVKATPPGGELGDSWQQRLHLETRFFHFSGDYEPCLL